MESQVARAKHEKIFRPAFVWTVPAGWTGEEYEDTLVFFPHPDVNSQSM